MEEKKKKGNWDQASLQTAITKVMTKELSLRQASMRYNIPKSTLYDKTSALNRGEEVTLQPKIGRFYNTFTPEYEKILVDHAKDLASRCLPLMKKEFLKLAFDLAESMKIPNRFNKEKRIAGKHFYYDFMKRHRDISLRIPESTSMMRAVGFNKPQVDHFYNNLDKLITLHKFLPSNIYNCDETGVSCVHKHQKVLAPKAVRQVGKLTSAERGKNLTVLFCMSAIGHFLPPFFVFPRQRMNDRLLINAPAGSVGVAQPKGWMNSDFFLRWLQLFVKHSHPTKESPVLLLLDGHSSHKTLAVINFCRENNIHLISFPPHTTHKLQPLDRTFMKPFKDAYNQRCDLWMRANPGSRITEYDIAGLVNEAFTKVARLEIAVSGFKCTGIYPFDRNLFSNQDYLAADMTNIPLKEPGTSSNTSDSNEKVLTSITDIAVAESTVATCNFTSRDSAGSPLCSTHEIIISSPKPSTSFDPDVSNCMGLQDSINEIKVSNPRPSTIGDPDIIETVHKLSPLPDAVKKRSATRKRKCEKSEILTSSPYKIAVEEKENEKQAKEGNKKLKPNFKTAVEEEGKETKDGKAKGIKGKQAKGVKAKNKGSNNAKKKLPLTESSQSEKTICVLCLEDNDEDWIQCSSCNKWAHEACADVPECSDAYICDRCQMI